jgi:hypothetical protein
MKIERTEQIYIAMQNQFPELKYGKPDISWEEMWEFYDLLDPKHKSHIIIEWKDLLPYHLWINLSKPGYNVFFKLPDSHWENL